MRLHHGFVEESVVDAGTVICLCLLPGLTSFSSLALAHGWGADGYLGAYAYLVVASGEVVGHALLNTKVLRREPHTQTLYGPDAFSERHACACGIRGGAGRTSPLY